MAYPNVIYVYSDESGIDSGRYLVIGSLWIPAERAIELERRCREHAKSCRMTRSDFKWTKLSRTKMQEYIDMVNLFILEPTARYKCIVIDKSETDYDTFHQGDEELGFYKFFFQLLTRTMSPSERYVCFPHRKPNRKKDRLDVLKSVTNNYFRGTYGGLDERLVNIEPKSSYEQPIIQIVDILTGAVRYDLTLSSYNKQNAKQIFCEEFANVLSRPRMSWPTYRSADKFNVWHLKYRKRPASY